MAQFSSCYSHYTPHGDISLGIFDTHTVSWPYANTSTWSTSQQRTQPVKHRTGQPYYSTAILPSIPAAPKTVNWWYDSPPYLPLPESSPSPSQSSSSSDTSPSPHIYPSSPLSLMLPQIPETHVVCNAPLVAPVPLPYHSPTFLQFNFLPDIDEDLSQPPYTQRLPKRKRTETDENSGTEDSTHPMIKRPHTGSRSPCQSTPTPVPFIKADSSNVPIATPPNAKTSRPPGGLRRPTTHHHTLR